MGSDHNCFFDAIAARLQYFKAKKSTINKVLDLIEDIGRRDWTRTNDPHHVKVVL